MSFSGRSLVLAVLFMVAILGAAKISYNSKTQLCCNGTVVDMNVKRSMSCCGGVSYDYFTSICCNNEVLPLPSEKAGSYFCCHHHSMESSSIYDYSRQMCCDGLVIDKPDPNSRYGCCNGELYNPTSHVCCGGELREKVPDVACCGKMEMYDTKSQICCENIGAKELLGYAVSEGNTTTSICCGLEVCDLTTDTCCNGVVTSKKRNIGLVTREECCGEEPYDPKTQICCSKRRQISEPGFLPISTKFEDLEFVIHDIENGKDGLACCGHTLYNQTYEMCCTDGTVMAKPKSCSRYQCLLCCEGKAITNHNTQFCINNKFLEKVNYYDMLCGNEMYNHRTQFCCGHKVYERNSTMECCNAEVYDKTIQKCCSIPKL